MIDAFRFRIRYEVNRFFVGKEKLNYKNSIAFWKIYLACCDFYNNNILQLFQKSCQYWTLMKKERTTTFTSKTKANNTWEKEEKICLEKYVYKANSISITCFCFIKKSWKNQNISAFLFRTCNAHYVNTNVYC